MHRRISDYIRRNAIGCVALFVALSGSAFAIDGPLPGQNQVGSEDIIDDEVRAQDIRASAANTSEIATGAVRTEEVLDNEVKSADLRDGQVQTQDIATGGVQTADVLDDSLRGEDLGNNVVTGAKIDEATLGQVPSAAQANNASSLGGVAAGSYQRKCVEGAVRGWIVVNGASDFPTTYTSDPSRVPGQFNCTGGAVQAKRVATGTYHVRIENLGGNILAVGNVYGDDDNFLGYSQIAEGAETVHRVVTPDHNGNKQDRAFAFALP